MKAPLSLLAVLSICLSLVLCPAAPVRADDPLPQAPAPAQPGGPSSAEPQLPPGVSTDWWTTVQRDIQQSEYNISRQEGDAPQGAHYAAPNRAQAFRTSFTPEGIHVAPLQPDDAAAAWDWGLRLVSVNGQTVDRSTLGANGGRIEYPRGALTEWYVNDDKGLEQGFTLASPPAGDGAIKIELAVSGGLTPAVAADGSAVTFAGAGGSAVLRYADLRAVDATGRTLPARLELTDAGVTLHVDAAGATYPVVVDPTVTGLSPSANWTADSNQAGANFGYAVATAGDVNGDGYADVIVGAPYFDDGETDEGAAWVYLGSASGLSATAAWGGEPNQGGAHYGWSVGTAGDVNGDGYADIIVGAPDCNYGQAGEGVVFVYHGSASGAASSPAWVRPSTQVGANFGYSVGTAGDVNGDGYADAIVGAPYFDDGETDEGAAWVYPGSASGLSGTPVWGGESDQTDGHYGWSVGTAGDVNGDGYSDVVVGIPSYTNGEGNEGAAFVYLGSASGMAWAWGAESNQANANFGYSVGTAGDVNGDGCADVIVGAPYYDIPRINDEGRAFAYLGSGAGIDGSPAWTADSGQADGHFGWSVGTAGDVNGDGYADVVVGMPWYTNGEGNEGAAFVYFGESGALGASGTPANAGWRAESNQANANLGWSVAAAGDVNGDGYSDMSPAGLTTTPARWTTGGR